MKRRMLDLFAGRLGWSKAFLARGWEVTAVDIVEPPEIPAGVEFIKADVLNIFYDGHHSAEAFCINGKPYQPDFICASSPCEKFSVFDLKMWFPNPKYPSEGIELFNHARRICEASGVPYVMENVRAAQEFVGQAVKHCGPFYLWGSAVPPLMPQGITKGSMLWSPRYRNMKKSQRKKEVATIPPELANCVADYAERLLENDSYGATACRAEQGDGRVADPEAR